MCGICGWLSITRQASLKELERMNNIAKYRGPDDEGYLIYSLDKGVEQLRGDDSCLQNMRHITQAAAEDDGCLLAMAHRRLSILDLSAAGHQPMLSEDDRLVITYNGEIYNYVEVREELIGKGYPFHSNCDTEVILQAYREWGQDCVLHFNGMWSFVIWDREQELIFASRDRLGAKPFYYYFDGKNFVFSSELKQLCQCSIMPRTLNEDVLLGQVAYSITDYSDECLIREAKVLRGGHSLVVQYDIATETMAMDVKEYWDFDAKVKDETAKDTIFDTLDTAVRIRLRSDVPVGVMLSGGLDSSVITAKVAEDYRAMGKDPSEIQTFTSCYEDFEAGDEWKYAHMVNEHCKTTERKIYPKPEDVFETFKEIVWHYEGSASIGNVAGYLTVKAASEYGCKVILNGQGSDETMFGYERYYAWYLSDILATKGPIQFVRELRKAEQNSRLSIKELISYYCYFQFPAIHKLWCYRRIKRYVSDEMLKDLRKDKSLIAAVSSKTLWQLQKSELRKNQLPHILRWDDRTFMAHSMESRVPFIDYQYIEKAVKIPENLKIRDGYTKVLLRDDIEGHLPDEVVWRKNKMGWPSPVDRWARAMDREKVEELFETPRCARYFNVEEIREMYEKNPAHRMVGLFMNIELFMRLFDVA